MSEPKYRATAHFGRETHILRTDSAIEALAYAQAGTEGGMVATFEDNGTMVAIEEVAAK